MVAILSSSVFLDIRLTGGVIFVLKELCLKMNICFEHLFVWGELAVSRMPVNVSASLIFNRKRIYEGYITTHV